MIGFAILFYQQPDLDAIAEPSDRNQVYQAAVVAVGLLVT